MVDQERVIMLIIHTHIRYLFGGINFNSANPDSFCLHMPPFFGSGTKSPFELLHVVSSRPELSEYQIMENWCCRTIHGIVPVPGRGENVRGGGTRESALTMFRFG